MNIRFNSAYTVDEQYVPKYVVRREVMEPPHCLRSGLLNSHLNIWIIVTQWVSNNELGVLSIYESLRQRKVALYGESRALKNSAEGR
jgi:hypothetical protein